ncbi:macro domain-containing protein [Bradyrhizobium sp. Pear77]|uniref:macro domain-containing protein n=1 Tax=Bradyrhizobium altum TaxID=1571202 RepID=UPI001E496525|nr:macro domain-containing protein [Bradyrhizobium altum]MCC8957131.1 macro domain-containing protein [Bradyrhizobium altum]
MQKKRTYRVGDSTLSLVFGDITTSTADVLVSSDDSDLSMGGGVSAAIRRAAGQSIMIEAEKNVPAKLGDVVVTSAGSLKARHVFHAITIGEGEVSDGDIVANATRRCLKLLDALGLSSIAFPTIGAGVARFSYEDVATNMAQVIVSELRQASRPFLITIYLFDRFGEMEPLDYIKFFEEFAARTHGLTEEPTGRSPAPRPADRRARPSKQPTPKAEKRTGALTELAELDRERQALEDRLARFGRALRDPNVTAIVEQLNDIQQRRIALLSAVTPRPSSAVSVFVSYAHEDEALQKQLRKHLSVLEKQGLIASWHDRMIGAGTEWEGAIDSHLNSARVILLLVSPDFIASPYCYDVEMARALERHEKRDALVIPAILRAVHLKGTPFAKLQALPKDAKPIVTWNDPDTAFVDVTDGLYSAIQDIVGPA